MSKQSYKYDDVLSHTIQDTPRDYTTTCVVLWRSDRPFLLVLSEQSSMGIQERR